MSGCISGFLTLWGFNFVHSSSWIERKVVTFWLWFAPGFAVLRLCWILKTKYSSFLNFLSSSELQNHFVDLISNMPRWWETLLHLLLPHCHISQSNHRYTFYATPCGIKLSSWPLWTLWKIKLVENSWNIKFVGGGDTVKCCCGADHGAAKIHHSNPLLWHPGDEEGPQGQGSCLGMMEPSLGDAWRIPAVRGVAFSSPHPAVRLLL